MGWLGVDLDGTIAQWESGQGIDRIGNPIIGACWWRLLREIDGGREVRIMTARVSTEGHGAEEAQAQRQLIQDWLEAHGLPRLAVTCEKDQHMEELWDDRARQIQMNTGAFVEPRQIRNRLVDEIIGDSAIEARLRQLADF